MMQLNLRRYALFYSAIMLAVIAVDMALAQWTSTDLPAGMSAFGCPQLPPRRIWVCVTAVIPRPRCQKAPLGV